MLDLEKHLLNLRLASLELVVAVATPLGATVPHIFQSHGLGHRVHLGQNALVTRLDSRDDAEFAAQKGLRIETSLRRLDGRYSLHRVMIYVG